MWDITTGTKDKCDSGWFLNEEYPKSLESKKGHYSGTSGQGNGSDKTNYQCDRAW